MQELGTDYPFAHKELATVRRSFFANIVGLSEDAGESGQLAFEDIIDPFLKSVSFDQSDMAKIWKPYTGVWINPAFQAGAPCVDGTRIPTAQLAGLIGSEKDIDSVVGIEVSEDYGLTADQIRAALSFEASLVA